MLAAIAFGATYFNEIPQWNWALYALSFLTALTALSARATLIVSDLNARRALRSLRHFVDADEAPTFFTNRDGALDYVNKAARSEFSPALGGPLSEVLARVFANPAAVLFRLQNAALHLGAAQEDVVTRKGTLRLNVHSVSGQGMLWRLERVVDPSPVGAGADALSVPMMTSGPSGAVLFVNDAARRFFGRRPKSLGQVLSDVTVTNGLVEIDTSSGPHWARVERVDVSVGRRDYFFFPIEGADGNSQGFQETKTVFETLPVALLELSHEGKIENSNAAATRLIGSRPLPGTHLTDVVEGFGRPLQDWIAETLNDGQELGLTEVLRLSAEEQERYLEITLSAFAKDESTVELYAILNDATELKTLEAQFVQSQKMQAIGQLAGGVAHDFNNLLTAISGHCDLLLLRHSQDSQDYADLVQIHQNANRAASLVGQLLAFSRKQNLLPEVIDLRDTLSDLTHLLNRLVGEKVALTVDHDASLPTVKVDKRQFEQVVMNLVVNARDAMSEGGGIKIITTSEVLEEALHRDRAVVPPGQYVKISVEDEGCGIPAEKLPKIFEPFYTTKRQGEGTGLGLSMAYGIVKQTGGFIFVESNVGHGTTFTLYFPTHEKIERHMPPLAQPNAFPPDRVGDGVVLLVEDEAPVRAFASRALQMRGFTVIEAGSAEEALETLEDEDLGVDVFVTDVIMPGLDGPTWVQEALKKRPDVSVVFVSGYAEQAFEDGSIRIPNSVFLPKPFSLNDLTATVQSQLI